MKADPDRVNRHGTRSCYGTGCRCAPCRRANADYQAAYMARIRAAEADDRKVPGYVEYE